jgi:hypothetical protein
MQCATRADPPSNIYQAPGCQQAMTSRPDRPRSRNQATRAAAIEERPSVVESVRQLGG